MAALSGQIALITGAGSGVGRATAALFAKEGAKVIVVDIDKAEGEKTVAQIHIKGGTALFEHADVAKAADAKAADARAAVAKGSVGRW